MRCPLSSTNTALHHHMVEMYTLVEVYHHFFHGIIICLEVCDAYYRPQSSATWWKYTTNMWKYAMPTITNDTMPHYGCSIPPCVVWCFHRFRSMRCPISQLLPNAKMIVPLSFKLVVSAPFPRLVSLLSVICNKIYSSKPGRQLLGVVQSWCLAINSASRTNEGTRQQSREHPTAKQRD